MSKFLFSSDNFLFLVDYSIDIYDLNMNFIKMIELNGRASSAGIIYNILYIKIDH